MAVILRPLLTLATRRRWSGLENLPTTGGIIVAVNHLSYVDPLLVGHLLYDAGRIPRFMGKSELFTWPLVGRVMTVANQIPVHRNSPDASLALRDAVLALQAGECVVIYPEGTVTRDPDGWPMAARTGVARLAALSGAPVIPVAQWVPSGFWDATGGRGCWTAGRGIRSPSWSDRPWTSTPVATKGTRWRGCVPRPPG